MAGAAKLAQINIGRDVKIESGALPLIPTKRRHLFS
jgi:hypothetical protein